MVVVSEIADKGAISKQDRPKTIGLAKASLQDEAWTYQSGTEDSFLIESESLGTKLEIEKRVSPEGWAKKFL